MVPELHYALQDWCAAHGKEVKYVSKGENCLTEMYSVIAADVPLPEDPQTAKNVPLLDSLKQADNVRHQCFVNDVLRFSYA